MTLVTFLTTMGHSNLLRKISGDGAKASKTFHLSYLTGAAKA
jgi:hypothetical protein